MIPSREEAERILAEAEICNPGQWGEHSRIVAHCAQKIAERCEGMNANKAYVCGLLHDIGRKFGYRQMGHIYDGWKYMLRLGYDEVAKICLTHSFGMQDVKDYVGKFDVAEEEQSELEEALNSVEYDDYDLLIQLCDAMAGSDCVMDIVERMNDVKRRYGSYSQGMWDKNLELKKRFEERAGENIYKIVGKCQ